MSVYPPKTKAELTHIINHEGYVDIPFRTRPAALAEIKRLFSLFEPEKLYVNMVKLKAYWRIRVAWRK